MSESAARIVSRMTVADGAVIQAVGVNAEARFVIRDDSELSGAWGRLAAEGLVRAEASGVDDRGVRWTEYSAASGAREVFELVERSAAARHAREASPWGGHPPPALETAAVRYIVSVAAQRRGALTRWRGGVPFWLRQLRAAVLTHAEAAPLHLQEVRRLSDGGADATPLAADPGLEAAAAAWTAWTEAGSTGRAGQEETRARLRRLIEAANRLEGVDKRIEQAWTYLTSRDDDGWDRPPAPFPGDLLHEQLDAS
jgi:hypothetical protein